MKNLRMKVRIRKGCAGTFWDYGIFDGNRKIIVTENFYAQKSHAIRAAKAISRRTGIKYDPEIVKQHGC